MSSAELIEKTLRQFQSIEPPSPIPLVTNINNTNIHPKDPIVMKSQEQYISENQEIKYNSIIHNNMNNTNDTNDFKENISTSMTNIPLIIKNKTTTSNSSSNSSSSANLHQHQPNKLQKIREVISVESSRLNEESLHDLYLCQQYGFIDSKKTFKETGQVRCRALIMDVVDIIPDTVGDLKLVSRTVKYLQAICQGIRILDSKWLTDSLININKGGKMLKPHDYEVAGTVKDRRLGGPQRAKIQMKQHGRLVLLDEYDFTIVRIKTCTNFPYNGTHIDNNELVSEPELRWMIDLCGGSVVHTIYHDQLLRDSIDGHGYSSRPYHIYLISSSDEKKLDKLKDSNNKNNFDQIKNKTMNISLVSLFWLLDVISNQDTPEYSDIDPFIICRF